MEFAVILISQLQRFLYANLLWFVSWPILYYFKLGEITGPKAWFWIIGEINYPVVAIAYFLLDSLCVRIGMKSIYTFVVSIAIIAICMPYYYQRFGVALGVTKEARYL